MTEYPILSLTTFLPLLGAVAILASRSDRTIGEFGPTR